MFFDESTPAMNDVIIFEIGDKIRLKKSLPRRVIEPLHERYSDELTVDTIEEEDESAYKNGCKPIHPQILTLKRGKKTIVFSLKNKTVTAKVSGTFFEKVPDTKSHPLGGGVTD